MNEHIDMKISGSSTMPGGEYGRVSISAPHPRGGWKDIHRPRIYEYKFGKKLRVWWRYAFGSRCS